MGHPSLGSELPCAVAGLRKRGLGHARHDRGNCTLGAERRWP